MSMVSFFVLYGILIALLFLLFTGVGHFLPIFSNISVNIIYFFILIGVLVAILMVVSIIFKKDIFSFFSIRYFLMKYIAPVANSISKRIWLDNNKMVRSYIDLSNKFIINKLKNKDISNILLLLPHCIQLNSCGMKLTYDITNCKMCGKCAISNLIELSKEFSVHISVASGGTMARKQVAEVKPCVVLAVACERDLLSGIRDTLPMNVLGVLNKRPNGHCVNTTVDTENISSLIREIRN